MRKLIFSIFILISFNLNAQCNFSFDELMDLIVSNSSEYETKILTKGYDYDSKKKVYFCFQNNDLFSITNRFQLDRFYGIQYSTFSKENYLEIKKRIDEMKFSFSGEVEVPTKNIKGLLYISNNIRITLFTETMDRKPILTPIYNILLQIDLLDTK